MAESTSSAAGRMLRLPTWVIALLLVAGLLSVAFAGGTFTTFLAVALFVANLVGVALSLGAEVKRLRATYVGHGPVDKAELRKEARKSQAIPLWLVATLAAGSIWTGILVAKVIGFVVAVGFVVGLLALVGFGAYKAAKKAGMID